MCYFCSMKCRVCQKIGIHKADTMLESFWFCDGCMNEFLE